MKLKCLLFLVLIFLGSCDDSLSETDILYKCLTQNVANEGESISAIAYQIEKHLIAENILLDSSAESYKKMLENLALTNQFKLKASFPNNAKVSFSMNVFYNKVCLSQYKNYSFSKMNSLYNDLDTIYPEPLEVKDLVNIILEHLNEEDYHHPYYKSLILLLLERNSF